MNAPNTAPVHYVRTGPRGGTPVLLLHAVGTDLTLWMSQLEALYKQYDVIAMDLPGHGFSPALTGELSFDRFAAVTADLIQNIHPGSVHVVGISFGAMVAQALAISHPDLVSSLSLLGSACTFAPEIRAALQQRAAFTMQQGMKALVPLTLERWFTAAFRKRRPDITDLITRMLYSQDSQYHTRLWEIISHLEMMQGLSGLSIPAQVIVGKEDGSTPVSAAQFLAAALQTVQLHVVPGAAHIVNLEMPDTVNHLLIKFLNSQAL